MLSVSTTDEVSDGPNVESALSMSPTTAMMTAEPHKPTIGARRQAAPKKGVNLTTDLMFCMVEVLWGFVFEGRCSIDIYKP